MDTALLIEKSILVLLLFLVSLGAAAYMTYFERKLAAWIQDRVGPDRAGPFGILQPIADGVKMFLKEDFIPAKADKWLFIIGPGIAMFTALITSAVIPWGPKLHLFGRDITLQVADINIGTVATALLLKNTVHVIDEGLSLLLRQICVHREPQCKLSCEATIPFPHAA